MSDDELYRALGRIEGNLEAVLEAIRGQTQRLDNHAGRLARLEKWKAWTLGAGAAAGAGIAAIWAVLTQVLHGR
jgi:hypothetical protein